MGLLLWLTVVGAMAACGSADDTARGIAEQFVDAHYVQIDLQASRPLTKGLAREKVDEEIRLTAGQAIDASTRVPRINYELSEERIGGADVVSYAFDATIRADGSDPIERTFQVTVRRDEDGWKVTNYQEY